MFNLGLWLSCFLKKEKEKKIHYWKSWWADSFFLCKVTWRHWAFFVDVSTSKLPAIVVDVSKVNTLVWTLASSMFKSVAGTAVESGAVAVYFRMRLIPFSFGTLSKIQTWPGGILYKRAQYTRLLWLFSWNTKGGSPLFF